MENNKTNIKSVYKYNTMLKLMSATRSIIEEKNVNSVTIREIASRCGLNSATIYKHFDNLDHLIFYVSMKYIEEYIHAIPTYVKNAQTSVDFFLQSWECFFIYSFKDPDIYYRLYFTNLENDSSNYIEEYYKLFPYDQEKLDDVLSNVLFKKSISERNQIVLDLCAKEGYFEKDIISELSEIQMYIYESLITRVKKNQIDSEDAMYKGLKYIYHITKKYSSIDFTYISPKYGKFK